MSVLVEACVEDPAAASAAAAGGAARLELCDELSVGGTTPTPELVEAVAAGTGIPFHLLIRPRAGGFVYDEHELAQMLRDVAHAKRQGAAGVVVGALDEHGAVAVEALCRLRDAARPLSVTFHRAFDQTREPLEALELLIELGIERVLSSGQAVTAEQGIPLLRRLVRAAEGRIVIMAGGGIRSGNAARIARETGVQEIHSSGGAEGFRALVGALGG